MSGFPVFERDKVVGMSVSTLGVSVYTPFAISSRDVLSSLNHARGAVVTVK